jgi:hypothetical protein
MALERPSDDPFGSVEEGVHAPLGLRLGDAGSVRKRVDEVGLVHDRPSS